MPTAPANGLAPDDPTLADPDSEGSDPPRTNLRDWPDIPDGPDAAWRATVQERIDGLQVQGADTLRIVRRMDERAARGGPVVRLATSAGTGLATFGTAALGEKGANVKYLVVGFIVAVAIAYGATVGLGANGVTVGGAAAAGPSPLPADPQE